jgi:hypothetical protein
MQPATNHPIAEFGVRRIQGARQLTQPPFPRGSQRRITSLVSSTVPSQQLADQFGAEGTIPFGWHKAFSVARCRHPGHGAPACASLSNTAQQSRYIAPLGVRFHRPDHFMVTPMPPRPMAGRLSLFARAFHVHHHLVDEAADDLLAIGIRGARGVPQGGNVGGEGSDPRHLLVTEFGSGLAHKAVVVILQVPLVAQGLFPALLQGRGHQTMRWVDRLLAALGQFDVVAGPFALLLPMGGQSFALALDILTYLETPR